MWDLPGPGLEPVSPALAGGFLTTVPPGKPSGRILNVGFTTFSPQGEAGSFEFPPGCVLPRPGWGL